MKDTCIVRAASKTIASVTAITIAIAANSTLAEWETYQGNAAHTGYVPGTLDFSQAKLEWRTPAGSRPLSGLAIGGGTVFVANDGLAYSSPSLYALDQSTGSIRWTKAYGNFNFYASPPAYSNGIVYVQTSGIGSDFLHAYTGQTGADVYAVPYLTQGQSYLHPTPYGGNIYTGGGLYGGMCSFDGAGGHQNWYSPVADLASDWTPAVDANYCYAYTSWGDTSPVPAKFYMVDCHSGSISYSITDTDFLDYSSSMDSSMVLGSHHNAFSIDGGWAYSIPTTGRLIMWDVQADSTHTPHIGWVLRDRFAGQPVLGNGVIYADDGGKLVALDESTGQSLWSWSPPAGEFLFGTMIVTDNMLLASTAKTTYAVDLTSHAVDWSYPVAGRLALSDNTLYIAGSDNSVYAVTVPDPATLSLLALAGVGLLARRRCGCA